MVVSTCNWNTCMLCILHVIHIFVHIIWCRLKIGDLLDALMLCELVNPLGKIGF